MARSSRLSPYVLRFREAATRSSLKLMWLWAGSMLLGLGVVFYKESQGKRKGCTYVWDMDDVTVT